MNTKTRVPPTVAWLAAAAMSSAGASAAVGAVTPGVPDPRIVFASFHGGDRHDTAVAVATDSAGHVFVAGETESRNLGAKNVGGRPLNEAVSRGYLTKLASDGKTVLWRQLIGGNANTVSRALTTDRDGNVYVAGSTQARDLPLKNPLQSTHGSNLAIAFLMKFSPSGELLFSTLLGGERLDEPRALAIDSLGNLYMAGRASSTTFPVKNAMQAKYAGGVDDAFIVKFTPSLDIAYSTFLGGAGSDHVHSIAVGPDDSLYVAGETSSKDLATAGAYVTQMQPYSSFAARIAADGRSLVYFTYIGWRSGYSVARAIAVDETGQAWVGGDTTARQLPTTANAVQKAYAGGSRDAFLLRLNAKGSAANYFTYLGGSVTGPKAPDETISAIRTLRHGHVEVVGHTDAHDVVTHRPLLTTFGGARDSILVRVDPGAAEARARVIHSASWGGAGDDAARAAAFGPDERVTVAGDSFSSDLPAINAVQATIGSNDDAFVMQFCEPWPAYSGFSGELTHKKGRGEPQRIEIAIGTGCPQAFAVEGAPISSATWITATGQASVPMKLALTVDASQLAIGEHRASIRLTVPDAFHPVLEIPVRMRVVE